MKRSGPDGACRCRSRARCPRPIHGRVHERQWVGGGQRAPHESRFPGKVPWGFPSPIGCLVGGCPPFAHRAFLLGDRRRGRSVDNPAGTRPDGDRAGAEAERVVHGRGPPIRRAALGRRRHPGAVLARATRAGPPAAAAGGSEFEGCLPGISAVPLHCGHRRATAQADKIGRCTVYVSSIPCGWRSLSRVSCTCECNGRWVAANRDSTLFRPGE